MSRLLSSSVIAYLLPEHLGTEVPKFLLSLVGLLQSSPLCYACSFFPLVRAVSIGSNLSLLFHLFWHVYYRCSRQFLSKYNQLSSQTLLPPFTGKYLDFNSLSAVDHISFSPGRKMLSQEKKQTHTWTENWEKRALEESEGQLQMENPAKGHGKIAKVETYFQFPSDLLPPWFLEHVMIYPKLCHFSSYQRPRELKINGKKPFKLVWKIGHLNILTV